MLFGHFTMQTKVWSLLEMEENKLISDMTKWGGRVPEGERNKCWRQSEACVAHEQWGFNMEYCTGMAWRAAVSFRASEGWSMLLICCLVCATAGMCHKDSHSQTWARGEHDSLNPCTLPSAGPGLVLVECHRVILDTNGGGASLCQKWHWAPHGVNHPRVAVSSLLCCPHPLLVSEWIIPMCNLQWRAAVELLWSSNSISTTKEA